MRDPYFVAGLLAVFAGIAALMAVLGVLYSPVTFGVAVPFAVAAALLYYQVSGRFEARVRRNARAGRGQRHASRGPRGPQFGDARRRRARSAAGFGGDGAAGRSRRGGGRTGTVGEGAGLSRREARQVLDVEAGAGDAELRRAYRDRAKDLHPDRGGDEEAFKRVTRAYERLRE